MWFNEGNIYPHYGNVAYTDNGNFTIDTSRRLVYEYDKNVAWIGSSSKPCSESTFNSTVTLSLLAMHDGSIYDNRRAIGKIYGCKIYDNRKLVRDYIPVRNSAGVCGLYD
jgi:hypothetical protein